MPLYLFKREVKLSELCTSVIGTVQQVFEWEKGGPGSGQKENGLTEFAGGEVTCLRIFI